jgi:hypothetical protein
MEMEEFWRLDTPGSVNHLRSLQDREGKSPLRPVAAVPSAASEFPLNDLELHLANPGRVPVM